MGATLGLVLVPLLSPSLNPGQVTRVAGAGPTCCRCFWQCTCRGPTPGLHRPAHTPHPGAALSCPQPLHHAVHSAQPWWGAIPAPNLASSHDSCFLCPRGVTGPRTGSSADTVFRTHLHLLIPGNSSLSATMCQA